MFLREFHKILTLKEKHIYQLNMQCNTIFNLVYFKSHNEINYQFNNILKREFQYLQFIKLFAVSPHIFCNIRKTLKAHGVIGNFFIFISDNNSQGFNFGGITIFQ